MAPVPNVRLTLANTAENVPLLRQVLAGVAEAAGIDADELRDISIALSEAANNVVLHAYEGRRGPLEVELSVAPGGLMALVRDRGVGIRPRAEAAEGIGVGVGLPVIHALARSVQVGGRDGEGTEVRLDFACVPGVSLAPAPATRELAPVDADVPEGRITISLAPLALARNVLPRVLRALAVRASLSAAAAADSGLLAASLLAHLDGALDGTVLDIAIAVEPAELGVRAGPLLPGRGDAVLAACASAWSGLCLGVLAEVAQLPGGQGGEALALALGERERAR